MKRKIICNHGEHENIPVICSWVYERGEASGDSWLNIVCKKCFIPEDMQDDIAHLDEYYNVGGNGKVENDK